LLSGRIAYADPRAQANHSQATGWDEIRDAVCRGYGDLAVPAAIEVVRSG